MIVRQTLVRLLLKHVHTLIHIERHIQTAVTLLCSDSLWCLAALKCFLAAFKLAMVRPL